MAFNLEIMTPEREFFSGAVDSLIGNTPDGQMGFLRDHSPIVVAVSAGEATIREGSESKKALLSGGFLEMQGDHAIILCDYADWPEEIDEARTRAEKAEAEERLAKKLSQEEYVLAQAALERAIQRLKVASRGIK
jgi:F-type H+-transporting ATPase subunit epsilon